MPSRRLPPTTPAIPHRPSRTSASTRPRRTRPSPAIRPLPAARPRPSRSSPPSPPPRSIAPSTTAAAASTNGRTHNTPRTTRQDDPGAYLRLPKTLTGSAADSGGSGIDPVAFQRAPSGGGAWTTIGTDTTAPYSTSFDTTTVADGQ